MQKLLLIGLVVLVLTGCGLRPHVGLRNFSETPILVNVDFVENNQARHSDHVLASCGNRIFSRRVAGPPSDILGIEIKLANGNSRSFDMHEIQKYNADLKQYPYIFVTPENQIEVGDLPKSYLEKCATLTRNPS